jgi:hypothetical protein
MICGNRIGPTRNCNCRREVLWWWTITSKWKPFLAMVPENGLLVNFKRRKRVLTGESLLWRRSSIKIILKVKFHSHRLIQGKLFQLIWQFEENSFARKILSFARPKVFLLESNSKKLGTGLFGGEGFIMQKIEGDGMALYIPEEH